MNPNEKTIQEIKVGDTVSLRDGCAPMRVLRVYTHANGARLAEIEYWDGKANHRMTHNCDQLQLAEPFNEEE
jgi:hypothetical protein